MYAKSIEEIKAFSLRQEPFFCKDIKKVLKENDALKLKILEIEETTKNAKAQYMCEKQMEIDSIISWGFY